MKLLTPDQGEIVIETPVDDPTQFDPAWRHKVARALSDNPDLKLDPEYSRFKYDPYIRGQVRFLQDMKAGTRATPAQRNFKLAFKWYQGSLPVHTRFRLEPLLLTPVSYPVIAEGLSGGALDPDPFITYQKLYFNIRNDEGRLSRSCHLRSFFALPSNTRVDHNTSPEEMWKVTAAQHGYLGLVRMWVWPDAPGADVAVKSDYMAQEAWRAAQALSLERLVRGRMSDFDLVTWIGKYTENEKMRRETNLVDAPAAKMASLLASVLQKAAPKVLEVAKDVDVLASEDRFLLDRFHKNSSALKDDNNVPVADEEKGVALVSEMLHTAFTDA